MRHSIPGGFVLVLVAGSLVAVALTGCGSSTANTEKAEAGEAKARSSTSADASLPGSGKGMAAIKQAADAGKYLFLFFSKADDDQTLAMRKVFQKAMQKVADRARWITVNTTDPSEEAIVAKFDLGRAQCHWF